MQERMLGKLCCILLIYGVGRTLCQQKNEWECVDIYIYIYIDKLHMIMATKEVLVVLLQRWASVINTVVKTGNVPLTSPLERNKRSENKVYCEIIKGKWYYNIWKRLGEVNLRIKNCETLETWKEHFVHMQKNHQYIHSKTRRKEMPWAGNSGGYT